MNGSIRERGKGSWEVSYGVGRDSRGKRQRRSFTVRGTKKEAQGALTDALYKRDHGTDVAPHKTTVGDYLERWLEDYARTGVAPSTFDRYAASVSAHIAPHIGNVQLGKLRPTHILDMLNTCQGEGLAASSIGHNYRVLHEALKHAVQWQLLTVNPADAVKPPRVATSEKPALDQTTLKKLLTGSTEPLRSIILFALHTGARPGELLALRWSDVDFEMGRILHRSKGAAASEAGAGLQ